MVILTLALISLPFLAVFYYYIRKRKMLDWFAKLTVLIAIVIFTLWTYYPMEDVFLRFQTKEQAFHYTHPFSKITNIYTSHTDEACEIRSGNSCALLEKDNRGWRRENYLYALKVHTLFIETNRSIYTIQVQPINKKWTILNIDSNERPINKNVLDSQGNQFEFLKNDYGYSCSIFVKEIAENYKLTIDDKNVTSERINNYSNLYKIWCVGGTLMIALFWGCIWAIIYLFIRGIIKNRTLNFNKNIRIFK